MYMLINDDTLNIHSLIRSLNESVGCSFTGSSTHLFVTRQEADQNQYTYKTHTQQQQEFVHSTPISIEYTHTQKSEVYYNCNTIQSYLQIPAKTETVVLVRSFIHSLHYCTKTTTKTTTIHIRLFFIEDMNNNLHILPSPTNI